MSIKNLKLNSKVFNKKSISFVLAGSLAATMLTSCGNYDAFDTKYTFNKVIVFGDNSATIYEIQSWVDYDGEQLQIETKDGFYFVTSSYDSKLIDEANSGRTAEEFAKSIKGEDVEIYYWDQNSHKTK